MAAYTRLAASDLDEILKIYGLNPLTGVEPLSLGISNSNYRCTLKNSQSIILKVSNDKNKADLLEEQRILSTLRDYSYSLTPFQTLKGETVYEWNGLNGVVFPFILGAKPMGSPKEVGQLGEALSLLHVFSIENKLVDKGLRHHSQVGYDLGAIRNYCQGQESVKEFTDACGRLLAPKYIELWEKSDLPKGLIHGDLYLDNTLFEDGKLNVLLDFEQAGIGLFIQDIGISISGSCLDKEGVSHEKVAAFIKGYQKNRGLEEKELELLNFSILLGFLDISLWRIKRFYEGDLDPRKRNSYQELLKLAEAFKKSIQC